MRTLEPVSRTTLSELVAVQVLNMIAAGRWKPGEKLPPETHLCKALHFSGTRTLSTMQRDWTTPYVQNWNFNIQHELAPSLRLQVGYVANKGTHMITPAMELNRFPPGSSTRPYAGFDSISYLQANGYTNYNSMQVILTKRMSRGLQFDVNYTWGHGLDDTPPVFSSNSDDHHPALDYGTAESDMKHLLSFDYVYQIPTISALPRWLGEGWQLNGLSEMRSGLAYSVTGSSCDPLGVGQYTTRADLFTWGVYPSPNNLPNNQINLAAFSKPSGDSTNPGTRVGNSPRGRLRGPAIFNWDFSVFKKFKFHERHEFEFRAEFFNIFNTPQFNLPGANISSVASFGKSTSTLSTVSNFGAQRQILFGLRYSF